MRLLLAEDEKALSRALKTILERNNYSVDPVYDGQAALDYLEADNYDGVILDIMMPRVDGLTVLKEIRRRGNPIPVLLLTAKSEIDDKVQGLDCGANDYLTKPFHTRELLARIRSALRKQVQRKPELTGFTIQGVRLEPDSRRVTVNGQEVELTRKEFDLLHCLMAHQGKVMNRSELLNSVWGYDFAGETNTVDVYIRFLRSKIDEQYSLKLIETVRGVGYVIR